MLSLPLPLGCRTMSHTTVRISGAFPAQEVRADRKEKKAKKARKDIRISFFPSIMQKASL
jgi:hypothetical protein